METLLTENHETKRYRVVPFLFEISENIYKKETAIFAVPDRA